MHRSSVGRRPRPDGSGLAYRDETPADRDRNGLLWARLRDAPGTGRPDYRSMHPYRQRQAMLHKLCQVCGRPADRDSQGRLFTIPGTGRLTPSPDGYLPYGHPATPWFLASQLVVELTRCTRTRPDTAPRT